MGNIWKNQQKSNKELELVIPIIVFNGKAGWMKHSFESLFDKDVSIYKKYLPSFEYELLDLSILSN
jgi:hypothetical protein